MKKIFILCLVFLFMIVACKKEEFSYNIITPEQAKEMMDENDDEIILDVRSRELYNVKHIKDAINVNYYELEDRFSNEVTYNKNALIFIYAGSSNLSKDAYKLLSDLGYKNLYLFGSIDDWEYDVVK